MSLANLLEPPRNKIPMSRSRFQNVEQYEPLKGWLDLHDARPAWATTPTQEWGVDVSNKANGPVVEGWRIASSIVYVILHPDRNGLPGGWDLAAPPSTTDIKTTFDDIEKQLGLEVAR